MHHTKRRLLASLCSFIIALIYCLMILNRQTITGRISSTVRDTSNAVLPGTTTDLYEASDFQAGDTQSKLNDAERIAVRLIASLLAECYAVEQEHGLTPAARQQIDAIAGNSRTVVDAATATIRFSSPVCTLAGAAWR